MWEMKSDLVPVSQLHTAKDSTEETTPVPWSYRPLDIEEIRWYWNKQPYSLKGTIHRERSIIEVPMPAHAFATPQMYRRPDTGILPCSTLPARHSTPSTSPAFWECRQSHAREMLPVRANFTMPASHRVHGMISGREVLCALSRGRPGLSWTSILVNAETPLTALPDWLARQLFLRHPEQVTWLSVHAEGRVRISWRGHGGRRRPS